MKNVIISSDDDLLVYAVPDRVADNLNEYCLEYCAEWLWKSPDAEGMRHIGRDIAGNEFTYVQYTSRDFIDYLNRFVFPDEPSYFINNLGRFNSEEEERSGIPEQYKSCPRFNF